MVDIAKFNIGQSTGSITAKSTESFDKLKDLPFDTGLPAPPTLPPFVNPTTFSQRSGNRGWNNPQFEKTDNVYDHDSDNYIVNTENIPNIKLNDAFQPNILDNYDVVTYHWKFFMVTPAAATSGEILKIENQTIIAESGVSDLTIDNVVIESITTPSVESGTGTSTNIKFTITEPAGAGLIDQIYYESIALGVGNWNVMPFYLQLQFRIRSPVDSSVGNPTDGSIGNLRWLWPLTLNSMRANVTNVGTVYEISAIPYAEKALSNMSAVLQHAVVLQNLTNFEDAMTKLQAEINKDQLQTIIKFANIMDVYKIVVDPKIGWYPITPINHNIDSQRNDGTFKYEGKNASFPAGTSIDKIIDSLLAHTDEYQKRMKDSATPGSDGKPEKEEINSMKKFWRIIPEARQLQYDPRRNNYAKEFTLFIVDYDIGILEQNVFQEISGDNSIEAQRKRLETYVRKSILKKKYNYIFTGLNDQIVNFNITINNAYVSALARMDGVFYNTANSDKGPVNHDPIVDDGPVIEKMKSAISFQHGPNPNSEESKKAYQTAVDSISAGKLPPDTEQRYQRILAVSKPESWANFEKSAAGGITNTGSLNKERLRSQSIATPIIDKTTDKTYKFISNVNPGGADAKNAYEEFVKGIKGKLRPTAYVDSMQQRQVGMGVESSSNSGIQKISSIFSTALHSSQDVSFAHISLTIKGDPFWLFPQPTVDGTEYLYNSKRPKLEAINWIKKGHFIKRDAVNIYGSDNFLLIRFRTPRVFDNSAEKPSGEITMSDVETFSGVFKVTSIRSKFENGKFTQELMCILDSQINIINFVNEIEGAAGQPQKPTNPTDLVMTSEIKLENSASPRIMPPLIVTFPGVPSELSPQLSGAKIPRRQLPVTGITSTSNIPNINPNLLSGLPNVFKQ